jgi:hypothetical protein
MEPLSDRPGSLPVLQLLQSGETAQVVADTAGATLLVTDRRVVVASSDRVALDIPFPALRRIQFDVERQRPATLVIVPEHPADEPQVLAIPPERYEEVATALTIIGRQLAGPG